MAVLPSLIMFQEEKQNRDGHHKNFFFIKQS